MKHLPSPRLCTTFTDDMDVNAALLSSSSDVRCFVEFSTVAALNDLLQNTDEHDHTMHPALLQHAVQFKWPILAVLAAVIDAAAANYCWIVWLIISIDLYILPDSIVTFEELAQYVIAYAVKNDHFQALHQSIEIFYPTSMFVMFTRFLHESRQCNFTLETCGLLSDFIATMKDDDRFMNNLLQLGPDRLSAFATMLLTKYLQIRLNSMEHSQQILDIICASDIAFYADHIDFPTIAAIYQIVQFTGIQPNIDMMTKCTMTETMELSDDKIEHVHSTTILHDECNRISDALVAGKHFTNGIQLASLLNWSKDPIIYEQWVHEFGNDAKIDFDICERCTIQYSISPITMVKFALHIADQLDYADLNKYEILLKALNTIKRHQLHKNDDIHIDPIEHEMYVSLLKNGQNIGTTELYCSEYFETIMRSERCVLFKTFVNLKEWANIERLPDFMNEKMRTWDVGRLEAVINCLLDQGDIVQALRIQGIFNHRTTDLHYLVFCMALCENFVSLYDLSADEKVMLSDGLKYAASKFNKHVVHVRRLSASGNTSESSSPNSRMSYMDSVEQSPISECEYNGSAEQQDILEAVQVC